MTKKNATERKVDELLLLYRSLRAEVARVKKLWKAETDWYTISFLWGRIVTYTDMIETIEAFYPSLRESK